MRKSAYSIMQFSLFANAFLQIVQVAISQDIQNTESIPQFARPTVSSVQPSQVSVRASRALSIKIDGLSPYVKNETKFSCDFYVGNHYLIGSNGRLGLDKNEIVCNTPKPDVVQNVIEYPDDHFVSILKIQISNGTHKQENISTNLTFYDCTKIRERINEYTTRFSCISCVSSPFPCDWCLNVPICTDIPNVDCRNDLVVNGVNHVGPSIRSGPDFCPAIDTLCDIDLESNGSEIMILSGTRKEICFNANSIPLTYQNTLKCIFIIDGRDVSVDAKLRGDKIYCEEVEFFYDHCSKNVTAQVKVKSDPHNYLENPRNIHFGIHKNPEMIEECGT